MKRFTLTAATAGLLLAVGCASQPARRPQILSSVPVQGSPPAMPLNATAPVRVPSAPVGTSVRAPAVAVPVAPVAVQQAPPVQIQQLPPQQLVPAAPAGVPPGYAPPPAGGFAPQGSAANAPTPPDRLGLPPPEDTLGDR
ncbi:MAG: hypothetical protein ACRDD1_15185 [Planctomycetia bacterium]